MPRFILTLLVVSVLSAARASAASAALPPNIAPSAAASYTSQYSPDYSPKFAIDNQIPSPGSHDDLKKAWAVRGDTHRNAASFSLTWSKPVTIAEVLYYGRTSWFAEECFKDYELYLDHSQTPLLRGTFQQAAGPQRIKLATPTSATTLTLKFTSSYNGLNPGADEIQVFATPVPEKALPKLRPLPPGTPSAHIEIEESPQLAAALKSGRLNFSQLLLIQRHPIDSTHVYTYHVEGFRPGGGLFLYDIPSAKLIRLVDSPTGQILDLELSYDAKTILFSWRKAESEAYHLFAINTDGSNLKQLTAGRHHNYNACFLPDGGIAFLSTRSARFAYCWISPAGLLYRMEMDGSNLRRLSANIVNDFTPSVMDDGRIIYSRWEYVDKPAIPIQSLWTIKPDGTGLMGFYGNRVLSPATFMQARSIPNTGKVLCMLTAHNGPARGAIGLIDRSLGDNAQAALANLTPEINIGAVDRGNGNDVHGPYETPYPLDANYFLVSKDGTVILRDYSGTQQSIVLRPDSQMGFANAIPLRHRPLPPVIASLLPDKTSETGSATVFIQDVYNGLEPYVKRGEVKEICVVQEMEKSVRVSLDSRAFDFQFPVISCGATYAGKKVWGFAPVNPDGSACFKVPAGVPIYFMALDAQGRALQRMRTFTHLMPGEVQGCTGCHEPRNQSAPVKHPSALSTPPVDLRPPDWGAGVGFDYSTVVQPVLDKHCVSCHSGPTPAKKLDFTGDKTDYFNCSYESLARGRKGNDWIQWDSPYVSWIPTYNGHEANILEITPKHWGSPASKFADIIIKSHPEVTDAERRRIFTWIDLNIPYYGTSETAYPNNPGCRRILPPDLEKTLAAVAAKRCASCHQNGKFPRKVWTRITNPQLNDFLTAPLPKSAGGSGACGQPIFKDTTDPDYQAILRTFAPIEKMLKDNPRDDMPGSKPAPVSRDCQ